MASKKGKALVLIYRSPNDAGQWSAATDFQTQTDAESARPLHQPGWTIHSSLPDLVFRRQGNVSAAGHQTEFHHVLKIANFSVLPNILEMVNPSLFVVNL